VLNPRFSQKAEIGFCLSLNQDNLTAKNQNKGVFHVGFLEYKGD
jgi:hypothetical protein